MLVWKNEKTRSCVRMAGNGKTEDGSINFEGQYCRSKDDWVRCRSHDEVGTAVDGVWLAASDQYMFRSGD